MSYFPVMTCGLLGMAIVFLVIPLTLRVCRRTSSSQRSPDMHHTGRTPIPRLGGLALVAAFVGVELFISAFFQGPKVPGRLVMALASLAMFGLGFWDDLRPVGARRKFLIQVLIATAVC